ncbi:MULTISPECIES: DUF1835 domain-containing protein [unclassified Lysinibacillus]|uniref:DUF1835 domain-containing protein n=2 Tax=Lysinibacillus TaxID=400634 RepID=UPI0038111BA5
MIEEIHKSIKDLSVSDAKNLLLSMMFRIKMMQESKNSPEEILEQLNSIYNLFFEVVQNSNHVERDYSTVHIVCGESPAGSLRVGLGRENKIIGFPDFFAVGPIWELHQEVGRKHRHEWLQDHLNYSDDYFEEEYENRFSKTLAEIDCLNEEVPIIIWTAENSNEQTGLRYLLYLLKEKKNEVFVINTTLAFQELFNTPELGCLDIHTGEVNGEQLNKIYQEKISAPLTDEDRTRFEREWIALAESKGLVRIWKNNKINTVNKDYFDDFIVNTARNLHAKQSEKEFMKSARLIGEVYGQNNQLGDAFIEYRVRSLVYKGVFEIKGIPKAMRYYSVKLR